MRIARLFPATLRIFLLATLTILVTATAWPANDQARPFFFRNGDRIVVVGDSITVGGAYVRYLEHYLRTRFPSWDLVVRNAGVNGYTAQLGFPIMDTDVLVWKPSVVIVNYGMNDGRRRGGVEYYQEGIVPYVDKLLANQVRVVLCSNSPLDNGDPPGQFTDFNQSFDVMATFAEQLAEDRGIPYVDQFNFCHTLWGENRDREEPVPVSAQTLAKHPSDPVHARAPGQLTMAYIILKTLGAPAEVSHAQIDVSGKVSVRNCEISDLEITENGRQLSFTRLDRASPCAVDDYGALGLALVPFQSDLNRMTLQVTGLKPGTYAVTIDDQVHGRYPAGQLAAGINLSESRASPVYDVGRRVVELVMLQKQLTYAARLIMFFKPPGWLRIADLPQQKQAEFARRREEIEQRDTEIAAAAQPVAHRYVVKAIPPPEAAK